MASKPNTRLPQLTSLRTPVATTVRKRPPSDEFQPLGKRQRKSSTENKPIGKMAPPVKRPPVPRMRRSVSMANIQHSASLKVARNDARSIKGISANILPTRQSSVTQHLIAKHRPNAVSDRRPAGNITNRINNVNLDAAQSELKPKGKTKRAAWDVKGRLVDMEDLLKETTSKLSDYDSRMASLESEKSALSQNLQITNTQNQNNEEKVANLHKELNQANEFTEELKKRKNDLEQEKNSLQNLNNNLNDELSAKSSQIASLNSANVQLISSRSGLDAEFTATKLLLESHISQLKELTELSNKNLIVIEELNNKLMQGEIERRTLHNTVQELKGNIRVFCRVRPLLKEEIENNGRHDVIPHINFIDQKSLELLKTDHLSNMSNLESKSRGNYEFKFDRIFTPRDNQEDIFEEISQLVQSALDGYNVCVFAYGQTGSGKTFTMEGVYEDTNREGMIPRSVRQIFQSIENLNEKGWTYKVEASFLEIYNDTIRDLLASPREAKNNIYDIKLMDGKSSDVYVTNLKIVPVTEVDTVHHLLNVAQQHRAVAATNLNERSSRSHSIFRLKLTGENNKTGETSEATLNLVDLAGSERLKSSGAEGIRLTETQNINKSLANLSNVILALAKKNSHIPYRNSKLTHLLQSSLGGNSKTLMFVAVSPLANHFSETVNSLRFAVKVNQCHIGTATRQMK